MNDERPRFPSFARSTMFPPVKSDAPPLESPVNRWSFLRCLATWMPGSSAGMAATATHVWAQPRSDDD